MNASYNCFVSIITPLHNKGDYIADTIKSVLSQTFANWEMIVIENGSSDNGPDIVRTFEDSRITFLVSQTVGPSAARNLGLDHATGEWVIFLDADDLLEPNYLEERRETITRNPDADIIFGPWKEFSETNVHIGLTEYPIGWETAGKDLKNMSFAYVCWPPLCAIIKCSIITENKRWPVEMDSLGAEDNGFWFSLLYQAQIAWSPNGAALYRKNTSNSRDVWAQTVDRRFAICKATTSRNSAYLTSIGEQPNKHMSAAAFRVLRSVWQDVAGENISLKNEVFSHMWDHLQKTSLFDSRMLLSRLIMSVRYKHS
jgi:glycosyltransferase involved in cell wall biosynthesis